MCNNTKNNRRISMFVINICVPFWPLDFVIYELRNCSKEIEKMFLT